MHGYLGRFRAGDSVPIMLAPGVVPDGPPQARVIALGPGAPGQSRTQGMSPAEGATDVFRADFPLRGGTVFVGRYCVRLSWIVSGVERVGTSSFDVVSGGDPGGAVIALHESRRPPGSFIVAQLNSGVLVSGLNPRV